jgi:hypothetical protein
MDIALGEEQVLLITGEDLGHPEAISQDLDGFAKTWKLYYALQLRQCSAQETPEKRPRCTPKGATEGSGQSFDKRMSVLIIPYLVSVLGARSLGTAQRGRGWLSIFCRPTASSDLPLGPLGHPDR